MQTPMEERSGELGNCAAQDCYLAAIEVLAQSRVPFLIGGAFALKQYTCVSRWTKDLDVFVRPQHSRLALAALSNAGYETEIRFPHWLGKAFRGEDFVDIIFSSGNGLCTVDDGWFDHAVPGEILGASVRFIPPEEMIWSKAFVMERDRYDGADIAHVMRSCHKTLDWARLLYRFHHHWRVLFSHVILFGFIYPEHRLQIPEWLANEFLRRLRIEMMTTGSDRRLCRGTLLSWCQYLPDIEDEEYRDARLQPSGTLTEEDTRRIADLFTKEQKHLAA
ncbi:MAG: hypothetical protein ACT4OO_06285 [Nitrospiraceae bacterium]